MLIRAIMARCDRISQPFGWSSRGDQKYESQTKTPPRLAREGLEIVFLKGSIGTGIGEETNHCPHGHKQPASAWLGQKR
jgi:hypothetical protein